MKKVITNLGLGVATSIIAIAGAAGAVAADDTSTSGYLTLSSYGGQNGSVVTIKGGDFHPNESVKLYQNRTGSSAPIATVQTNKAGKFTTNLTINTIQPYNDPYTVISADGGVYNEQTGSDQDHAEVLYNLESNDQQPLITLSRPYGLPGATVVVSGGGYSPNEVIRVGFGNFDYVNTTSDQFGDFSATFTVPDQAAQNVEVRANGGVYQNGTYPETATFEYQILDHSANAQVSQTSVKPGDLFYFYGITDAHHGIVYLNQENAKGKILSTTSIEADYNGFYEFPNLSATQAQAGKTLYYSVQAQGSSTTQQFQVKVTN